MALAVSHTHTRTQQSSGLMEWVWTFIPALAAPSPPPQPPQQPAFTFDQDLKWQRWLGWHVRQLPIRSAQPQATGFQPSSYPVTLPCRRWPHQGSAAHSNNGVCRWKADLYKTSWELTLIIAKWGFFLCCCFFLVFFYTNGRACFLKMCHFPALQCS